MCRPLRVIAFLTVFACASIARGQSFASFALPPEAVCGTNPVGRVKLDGLAPAGGVLVTLTSSAPQIARIPPSVTIPEGQVAANFTVTCLEANQAIAAMITATANSVTKTALI